MARGSTKLTTGRYDDHELEQLKRNISLLHLCAERGIELKPHGTHDYVGRCPLHEEDEPSFIVTPAKNLWHCMGCDKGGSVIDLVMELDGLEFKQAVEHLITSTGLVTMGTAIEAASTSAQGYGGPLERKTLPSERVNSLLERTLAVYEKNFAACPEGKQYLESRGINDGALFTKHRIGYSNGKLSDILPGNGGVRDDLKTIGVLLDDQRERFADCVVFPVFDTEGLLTTLYGRHVDKPSTSNSTTRQPDRKHYFLPNRSTGLWNATILKTYADIILVESAIDGLSVEMAGFPNVVAIQGTNGLSEANIELLTAQGVQKITLLLDGDEAGGRAVAKLRPRLEAAGLAVTVKALPEEHDPNSYLQANGAEALKSFLISSAWTPSELPTPKPASPDPAKRAGGEGDQVPGDPSSPCPRVLEAGRPGGESSLNMTYGLRTYHVLGLEKGPASSEPRFALNMQASCTLTRSTSTRRARGASLPKTCAGSSMNHRKP